MVSTWLGRELSALEEGPGPQAIAAQLPLLAFNVLAPSRAERKLVSMMKTATYQEGVAEMKELTSNPDWPAEWSVRGVCEWLSPPTRLTDE
jgi:hypothetical protein